MTGTLFEDFCSFMVLSLLILPRMRSVMDNICRENQNSHFKFSNCFRKFMPLWDNVGEGGAQNGFLRFHSNSGCANALQYYVVRTFPVLFGVI